MTTFPLMAGDVVSYLRYVGSREGENGTAYKRVRSAPLVLDGMFLRDRREDRAAASVAASDGTPFPDRQVLLLERWGRRVVTANRHSHPDVFEGHCGNWIIAFPDHPDTDTLVPCITDRNEAGTHWDHTRLRNLGLPPEMEGTPIRWIIKSHAERLIAEQHPATERATFTVGDQVTVADDPKFFGRGGSTTLSSCTGLDRVGQTVTVVGSSDRDGNLRVRDGVVVFSLTPESVRPLDTPPEMGEVAALQLQISELEERHERLMTKIRRVARRVGRDQGWCLAGQDEVLEELGVPTQEEVEITLTVTVTATAMMKGAVIDDSTAESVTDCFAENVNVEHLRQSFGADGCWEDFEVQAHDFQLSVVEVKALER